MDLRMHAELLSPALLERIRQEFWYQPFRFTDDLRSGLAPYWDNILDAEDSPTPPSLFDRSVLAASDPELCRRVWASLDTMESSSGYLIEAFIRDLRTRGVKIGEASFLDVGCNCGQYCFHLAAAGADQVVGLDAHDYRPNINIVSGLTGLDFEFQHAAYNPYTHRLEGEERQFDVVIANNVVGNLYDPIEAIGCLARHARTALFLFVVTTDDEQFTVRYLGDQPWQGSDWPYRFDSTISRGFCDYLLRGYGFSDITEMVIPEEIDFHPYWRQDVTFYVAYR